MAELSEAVDEKACPFCAETIKAAAIVCKHCGRDLPAQVSPEEARAASLGIVRREDRWVVGGSYFKDLEKAINYAGSAGTQSTISDQVHAAAAKPFKWWLWGPLALVVLVFAWGAVTGPKTYADLADMEEQSCIRRKGNGEWRASLGVTLEQFCKTVGSVEARRALCKAHPEHC